MMNEAAEESFDYGISEGKVTLHTAVGRLKLWFLKATGLPPFL